MVDLYSRVPIIAHDHIFNCDAYDKKIFTSINFELKSILLKLTKSLFRGLNIIKSQYFVLLMHF